MGDDLRDPREVDECDGVRSVQQLEEKFLAINFEVVQKIKLYKVCNGLRK